MELLAPYGGTLVNLVAEGDEKSALARRAAELFSLQLTPRALGDLELLATGAFSPLDRFMGEADARRVTEEMRLAKGTLFPVPVTLPVEQAGGFAGKEIALRTPNNNLIGWMKVEEVYEAGDRYCVSGPLRVIELPRHPDFPALRRTPAEVRAQLAAMGGGNVVAFQTGEPIGSAHEEMLQHAAREVEGILLLHVVAGMAERGDFAHYTRVRSYRRMVEQHYDPRRTLLNLLPLDMRAAGPRAAVWHAIIQRNFGASHFLVERSQAELLNRHSAEIGVQAMPYDATVPETPVREERQRGFCIWFTGLPSSGKSTVAEALLVTLMEHGRQVTLLDGDVVRTHLSKGLGFSKEDRDTNILRIGFVASEIVRHHGAVICAAVSPYRRTRDQARAMMRAGAFIEVFLDTPIEECERRDVKGYYAQAREGKIQGFTGVDDPYEPPLAPEIRLSTTDTTAAQNAARIVEFLAGRGLLW